MINSMLSNVITFFATKKKIRVDNFVFKLHYKLSAGFLLTCSILVSASQLFGGHISCFGDLGDIRKAKVSKAVETFCYVTGTYTIPKYVDENLAEYAAHPGLGHLTEGDEITYHNYYIWVPLVLFLQGLSFYVVHLIWKACDTSHLQNIMCGLDNLALTDEEIEKRMNKLVKYLSSKPSSLTPYIIFSVCEVLNLLVVVLNLVFTDNFLGGEFTSYGIDVVGEINKDPTYRTDPMSVIFPRVTKCSWYMYGASGSVQLLDAMCILPQNIMNEKVYLFLWIWFFVLLIASSIQILYRLLTFFVPYIRAQILRSVGYSNKKGPCMEIVKRLPIGDWFLVANIGNYMDLSIYTTFIDKLENAMKYEDVYGPIHNADTLPINEKSKVH